LVAEGFMLDNPLLTTVGALIGVSGSILSYIMCVAMNRGIGNVLFGGIPPSDNSEFKIEGSITKTTVDETADALATAESVIIIVGYGMAVAKAQYAISDITRMLKHRGVNVRFAIHPVAGRMPGQCNVLLAEASVPYDSKSFDPVSRLDTNRTQSFSKWKKSTTTFQKQISLSSLGQTIP